MPSPLTWLLLGDTLALALLTIIGFAAHNELSPAYFSRMPATFLPMSLAWFLVAPWLGLFEKRIVQNPRQLWRPFLTMLIAAPLAAVLRAAWLGGVVLPIFVVVLAGSNALGMMTWRAIWLVLQKKISSTNF
ncbi:MAG: DUF3054 domain-containing protein [Anaerolineales bacterium]|nr:DUF3054 domain-containing protein [Anaerolineales bacterium]